MFQASAIIICRTTTRRHPSNILRRTCLPPASHWQDSRARSARIGASSTPPRAERYGNGAPVKNTRSGSINSAPIASVSTAALNNEEGALRVVDTAVVSATSPVTSISEAVGDSSDSQRRAGRTFGMDAAGRFIAEPRPRRNTVVRCYMMVKEPV